MIESELAALVGAENVSTDEADCVRAASAPWSPRFVMRRQLGEVLRVRAVVRPGDVSEVAAVVRWAGKNQTALVPIGGASNLVEGTVPQAENTIALDLGRLDAVEWNEESLLVTVGAGANLAELETQLNAHEYTLGGMPASAAFATVGGAVATNAAGVLAGRYGRVGEMVMGLEAVMASGEVVRTLPAPGANAAFDLHNLFVGAEGAYGIITQGTLRIRPLPAVRAWTAFTFETFTDGIDAARLIYRSDARPACLRLFTAGERSPKPLLLLMFEGDELGQTGPYQLAYAICQKVGGTAQSGEVGEAWFEEQKTQTGWLAANARAGGVADAVAASAPWSTVKTLASGLENAVAPLASRYEISVSHAYVTGAALEIRWEAQATPATPQAALNLHAQIFQAAGEAAQNAGGSLFHHWGVGQSRREWFNQERGATATRLIEAMRSAVSLAADPNNGGQRPNE